MNSWVFHLRTLSNWSWAVTPEGSPSSVRWNSKTQQDHYHKNLCNSIYRLLLCCSSSVFSMCISRAEPRAFYHWNTTELLTQLPLLHMKKLKHECNSSVKVWTASHESLPTRESVIQKVFRSYSLRSKDCSWICCDFLHYFTEKEHVPVPHLSLLW